MRDDVAYRDSPGTLLREVLAARVTCVLGTLLQNGISLIATLGIVRDALDKRAATALLTVLPSVRVRGRDRLCNWGKRGYAQRAWHTCCAPGRKQRHSDRWPSMRPTLMKHVRMSLQRLVAILTPASTIVAGIVVGGFAASPLTAMLSLNALRAINDLF